MPVVLLSGEHRFALLLGWVRECFGVRDSCTNRVRRHDFCCQIAFRRTFLLVPPQRLWTLAVWIVDRFTQEARTKQPTSKTSACFVVRLKVFKFSNASRYSIEGIRN